VWNQRRGRATRQTELTYEHPQHVVCCWLGNSQLIAQRHYLQVTDEDFERAIHGSSKATQNATQHLNVSARTDSQGTSPADEETLVLQVPAALCETMRTGLVGDTGLEPVPILPQKTPFSQQGGVESGALFGDDERLRLLLEAWAELPESVKAAVMEMVRG